MSLTAELLRPVDLASRVAFRIGFAAIMLWEISRFFQHDWIRRYWIEPAFHFKYYGFGWVEPWVGNGMVVHVAVLAVLAALILCGLLYRVATALFFVGFTYIFLLEQARYLNHFYMVCLLAFLLIFVPAHRLFSIDALLRPKLRAATAPVWSLWLLRFQVGVVYFYGGIAKLNHDWLRGEPVGHWIAPLGETPIVGPLFVQPWSGLLFAYGGLLIDLTVVPLLLWRRTRWLGFAIVLYFNLANAYMFSIGIFPWVMIVASTIFFEPDWPRRVAGRFRRNWRASVVPVPAEDSPASQVGEPAPQLTPARRGQVAALAVYVGIQLLVPLRHWLYPGIVHWTEEGHRFAWHMKLREKQAQCWFDVRDPASGEYWEVYGQDILADWQERKMCTRPDMIQQFAHHIAELSAADGIAGVEVRARALASLHGRPFQFLVDPEVDLARERRTLGPADWIEPMKQSAPMGDF